MESEEIGIGCKLRTTLRPACFALALTILLASASLSAANRPRGVGVHLDYERGPGARQCPVAKALTDEVGAEIGSERFTETGPWRLRVAINRKKNGAFIAAAELFDSDGAIAATMEELVSVDCPTLVRAVAVWTAVKLTDPLPTLPSLPAAPPSSAPAPPPPPAATSLLPLPLAAPTPALPLAAPTLPPLPVAPPPLLRLRLGAATGIELGVGPTPTPLFSLNLALQSTKVPIVSLAFEGRADLPLPATGEGGARVHARAFTGSVLTCVHVFNEGILYLCPMFTAGVISSGDERSTADGSDIYSAAGGRVGVAIPFASHRFAFTLAGDVLATLHPFLFRFEERSVLWRTGSVAGAVQAGVWTFF